MQTSTWREWLYYRSPPLLQAAWFNAHAWSVERHRYGRPYRERLAWLVSRERAAPEAVARYQDERVRAMVGFAGEHSPYYRRLFREIGLDPRSVTGVDDLRKLPVTTKEQVRQHWAGFLTAKPRRSWLPGATSGTTGTPLRMWYDREMCLLNNAVDRRNKLWAGAGAEDWFGVLLGRVVVDPRRTRPPFWQVNHVQRQVWFSTFHLHPAHMGAMVAEVERRGLRFLEGYPSTLHVLARYLLDRGIRLPMRSVITSSETLHQVQRDDIEEAFGCRLFDFYASAERVIFAAECDRHSGKHLIEEYGYVEVVDEGGQPVPAGQAGFLAGTTLHNTAMPLLRYRMGDVTQVDPGPCPCGRSGRLMAGVATKVEDLITTPDGRRVSPSTLTHPFKTVRGVEMSQLVQERPDHLTVRVVVTEAFTAEEQARLVALLHDRVGDEMTIEVRRERDIPRERSGKFRWVISHVGPPTPGDSRGGAA